MSSSFAFCQALSIRIAARCGRKSNFLQLSYVHSPLPQICWGQVLATKFEEARDWFGERRELNVFHWHYESFDIPRGAKRMLFGYYGINKGFAIGKHLGLQIHLEVTEDIVREWCLLGQHEIDSQLAPSVQSRATILTQLPEKIRALHRISERVYTHWSAGLPRSVSIAVPANSRVGSHRESWGACLSMGVV